MAICATRRSLGVRASTPASRAPRAPAGHDELFPRLGGQRARPGAVGAVETLSQPLSGLLSAPGAPQRGPEADMSSPELEPGRRGLEDAHGLPQEIESALAAVAQPGVAAAELGVAYFEPGVLRRCGRAGCSGCRPACDRPAVARRRMPTSGGQQARGLRSPPALSEAPLQDKALGVPEADRQAGAPVRAAGRAGAVAVALAALLPGLLAPAPAAAASRASVCKPAGSDALARSRQVRVYRLDDSVYACLVSTARRRLLGTTDDTLEFVFVHAVAGTRVAYETLAIPGCRGSVPAGRRRHERPARHGGASPRRAHRQRPTRGRSGGARRRRRRRVSHQRP